jgi:hypothetical protein
MKGEVIEKVSQKAKEEKDEKVIRKVMFRIWEKGEEPTWTKVSWRLIGLGYRYRINPKTGGKFIANRELYKIYRRLKKNFEREVRRRELAKELIQTAIAYGDKQVAKKLISDFSPYLFEEEIQRYKNNLKSY